VTSKIARVFYARDDIIILADCWQLVAGRCTGCKSTVCSAATWRQKSRHRRRTTRSFHNDSW